MSRTAVLPQEILLLVVKYADVTLYRKLLFIRPFHHAVLRAHFAKAEAHVMMSEVESEQELRMWIFTFLTRKSTVVRKNIKQLHIHIHSHQRHLQLQFRYPDVTRRP